MQLDVRSYEECEIAAWGDLCRSASADAIVDEVNGALLASVPGLDVLAFNRAVGVGVREPATEATVDRIEAFFVDAGAPRCFVQVAPVPDNHLERWLLPRGFCHHNNWVRLTRDTAVPLDVKCDLDVREIGRDDAREFARIGSESLGWEADLEDIVAGSVGRPGWRHYVASDDGTPVATAASFAHGPVAWFDLAATLESHRGRGAQKALVARRLVDTRADGCREATV